MKRIALIPARAGSKRIPGKNTRAFCGRPIVEYSLEAALLSDSCDVVVVSTDDERVAEIAHDFGVLVIRRPSELADDMTPLIDVMTHTLECVEADALCLILATAPFVTPELVDEVFTKLMKSGDDGAMTIASFPAPIQRAFLQKPDGTVQMMWPDQMLTRSQDLPEAMYDAGQLYWYQVPALLTQKKGFLDRMTAVRVPRHRVQDIDTEEDWMFAEAMYKAFDFSA